MASDSEYLFIHGGPGFNSIAEEKILTPLFHSRGVKISFWNEPSRLRPDGEKFIAADAFLHWQESVARKLQEYRESKTKIRLLAHSFAAHCVVRICEPYQDVISEITIISSALNLYDAHKNIAKIAARDFAVSNPDMAADVARLLNETKVFFDNPHQQLFALIGQDQNLFSHYWDDKAVMAQYSEIGRAPRAQMDVEAFFAVLADLATHSFAPVRRQVETPVRVIFGANDPVINQKAEMPFLQKSFNNVSVHVFGASRHYAHLDQATLFLDTLGL